MFSQYQITGITIHLSRMRFLKFPILNLSFTTTLRTKGKRLDHSVRNMKTGLGKICEVD
jgi:hypothetical protein